MNPQIEALLERITDRMEQGEIPWRRPWSTGGRPTMPTRADHKNFSGVNLMLLSIAQNAAGYLSSYWLTYRQAEALGGQVNLGAKSTPAVLYKTSVKKDEASEKESFSRYLKTYPVFNAEQISGLPEEYYVPTTATPLATGDEMLEYFSKLPISLKYQGDQAYYSTTHDIIVMPPLGQWLHNVDGVEQFNHAEYYSTLGHEIIHWSGARHRLDRDFSKYGIKFERAREELVAELGSMILGYQIGLPVNDKLFDNHAAYLQSWVSILKDAPGELLRAAAKAQAAVDYINQCAEAGSITEPHFLAA